MTCVGHFEVVGLVKRFVAAVGMPVIGIGGVVTVVGRIEQ